jgi:hypothetical protein
MTLAALLADLDRRGIILFLENGELRYRSPKDALTQADIATVRGQRGEIVAYLKAREAARCLRSIKGESGPLTPSVAQEMWWRFAGAPNEGQPIALNIGMVRRFAASPTRVTEAIRTVLTRHEALRVGFRAEGEILIPHANAIDTLAIEQDTADPETALAKAREFCGRLIPILGVWLTRAKVIALPDSASLAVISAGHMVADGGTRNIVMDEIQDELDGTALRAPSVDYNSYSLAERHLLESPQGANLIAHWQDWYEAQPVTLSPGSTPLLWGTGTRIVCNFDIPAVMMARAKALAEAQKVTPFGIFMNLFALTIARWANAEDFPLRVLGDKRMTVETASTVGLMFCADAVNVHAPRGIDFETLLHPLLAAYDAAVSRRIPSLHYYPPQIVRPGIAPIGTPNRIPAVFNYFLAGTARERTEKKPEGNLPWPPQVERLTQIWPRVSSPLFLHLTDHGAEAKASLHFYADVVSAADQQAFINRLFSLFGEMLGR